MKHFLGWVVGALLLPGCFERTSSSTDPVEKPPIEPPTGCALPNAADEAEAQTIISDWYRCEGDSRRVVVSCDSPDIVWQAVGPYLADGRLVVGQKKLGCMATVGEEMRAFTFLLGAVTVPATDPSNRETGLMRCLRDPAQSTLYFVDCRLPQSEWHTLNTPDKVYDNTVERLICAGCDPEEHQIDCWGPFASMDFDSWMINCRVFDQVTQQALLSSLPFAPLDGPNP